VFNNGIAQTGGHADLVPDLRAYESRAIGRGGKAQRGLGLHAGTNQTQSVR